MAQDFLLTTNEYNEPKVLSGKDSIAYKLLMLLNMVPGTNPLHLEMGIDLAGKYRFCDPEDVETLRDNITHQIEVFMPEIAPRVIVNIQFNAEHLIETYFYIDDTVYTFETNDKETVLKLSDVSGSAGDEIPDEPDYEMNQDVEDEYDDTSLLDIDDFADPNVESDSGIDQEVYGMG